MGGFDFLVFFIKKLENRIEVYPLPFFFLNGFQSLMTSFTLSFILELSFSRRLSSPGTFFSKVESNNIFVASVLLSQNPFAQPAPLRDFKKHKIDFRWPETPEVYDFTRRI